jgi:single-strand DNA-binding protein
MTTINQMNHVNLIGLMTNAPQVFELENGKRIARFSMSTRETYLDDQGKTKHINNWHMVTAWGKWVNILEELGAKGQALAIEGKLRSRFYKGKDGGNKSVTEVEVNDLILL